MQRNEKNIIYDNRSCFIIAHTAT